MQQMRKLADYFKFICRLGDAEAKREIDIAHAIVRGDMEFIKNTESKMWDLHMLITVAPHSNLEVFTYVESKCKDVLDWKEIMSYIMHNPHDEVFQFILPRIPSPWSEHINSAILSDKAERFRIIEQKCIDDGSIVDILAEDWYGHILSAIYGGKPEIYTYIINTYIPAEDQQKIRDLLQNNNL